MWLLSKMAYLLKGGLRAFVIGFCCACALRAALSEDLKPLPVKQSDDTISVNVRTGGCTKQSDFTIDRVIQGDPTTVILRRLVPDRCKGWFPEGLWINFSKSALGTKISGSVQILENSDTDR
jgi:hypothetical protein